jgi:hypothetical protein
MRFLLIGVVLVASLSGCRKKSNPAFYQLESEQSVLLARDGDDAFASPELAAVLTKLEAFPEDALEKPRAEALVVKLKAGQARVKAERAPKPRPAAVGAAATGPRRKFLCEWTGSRFRGCVMGSFASVAEAEQDCTRGATEPGVRCSCGDSPSPADIVLCERMIADQKAR